jgi:hypothetical protein
MKQQQQQQESCPMDLPHDHYRIINKLILHFVTCQELSTEILQKGHREETEEYSKQKLSIGWLLRPDKVL